MLIFARLQLFTAPARRPALNPVLIKNAALQIAADSILYRSASDGRATVLSFVVKGRAETVASVYLPPVPSERLQTIKDIADRTASH